MTTLIAALATISAFAVLLYLNRDGKPTDDPTWLDVLVRARHSKDE